MKRSKVVEIGQRFRDARPTVFGTQSPNIWVVDRLFTGADGIENVHLTQENDPGSSKTISTASLVDRHYFVPLDA